MYFAAGITYTQLATEFWPCWHLLGLAACLGLLFHCSSSMKKQIADLPRECRSITKASQRKLKPLSSDHRAPSGSGLACIVQH